MVSGLLLLSFLVPGQASADYDACVKDVSPYLNVRNNKYRDSTVIGKLYSRTKVRVNTPGSTGYRKIHVPMTGWVSGAYLDRSGAFQNAFDGYSARVSTSGGNLNARSQPGTCFSVNNSLRNGTSIQVVAHTTQLPWALVSYKDSRGHNKYGYVYRGYIARR
ncbi:MAG: SH3 domain-containing protein [Granulosicoccus sp.]